MRASITQLASSGIPSLNPNDSNSSIIGPECNPSRSLIQCRNALGCRLAGIDPVAEFGDAAEHFAFPLDRLGHRQPLARQRMRRGGFPKSGAAGRFWLASR